MSGGISIRASAMRAALVAAVFVGFGLSSRSAHADAAEAKKIFTTRCTACHTFGKGVKVGPDLKGVTERRQRAWLLKFIRSSSKVIESGDEIATGLFAQFNQQRMPDWVDLSEEQVNSILDWLAANGATSGGRWGGWNYGGMEDAMLEGKAAAEEISKLS